MPGPITYADEVSPSFGIPWCDLLTVENGVVSADPNLTEEQIEALEDEDIAHLDMLIKNQHQADVDPINSGWSLDCWERVFDLWKKTDVFVIFGGNRSTKSTLAARLCVHLLKLIPECEIRCWHVNEKRSIEDQQRFIYEALSEQDKIINQNLPSRQRWAYSQKNGFTGDILILPPQPGYKRGSSIIFQNYKSFLHDNQVAEGFSCHFIWADEEIPGKLFDTLQIRCSDYRGKLMLTFTTLAGWSDVVTTILDGATTDKGQRGLKEDYKEYLPTEQTSKKVSNCKILYFWSDWNPFIPEGSIRNRVKGYSRQHRLARLYGIPEKMVEIQFPRFNDYNIIKQDELPWVNNSRYPVTHYMLCDPAGDKMWSMVWVAVDRANTWWVWREWPDMLSYGAWAEPWVNGNGQPIGRSGPAAKGQNYSCMDYAWHIKRIEEEEMPQGSTIFERLMDPRLGTTKTPGKEMQTTILTDINSPEIDLTPTFTEGPGYIIQIGLQKVSDLLAWDMNREMDSLNSPKIFVTENCGNVIYCMQNYTAKLGYNEATKDFPDCLRMGATKPIEYIPQTALAVSGEFGY